MKKIAIHSVPRSGSTWLGNIFNSHPDVSFKYQPLFSYAFKNYLNTNSPIEKIYEFFELIESSNDDFINQKEGIENGLIPSFRKNKTTTHICYKEVRYHHILNNMLSKSNDIKFIFLVRNPLAVLYSWKNAPKEFRAEKGWIFDKEWLYAPSKNLNKPEEYNGYQKWKESSLLFLELYKKYPDKVRVITYSDLIKNTMSIVNDIFNFSYLNMTPETQKFIVNSRSTNQLDSYSIYKTKKNDEEWEKLPGHIIKFVISDLKNTELETFLDE